MPSKTQIDSIGGASPGSTTYVSSFSPVLGGYYYGGSSHDESSRGNWWGSTAYNGARRYALNYYNSSLYTGNGASRSNGSSIRCIQAS
ncbi:hypothetical protein IKF84_02380 [Candidatus Saccharibacteria bacterium]|nr:hypothetical protein [Candidatus Saccharibacteria bacterium]